VVTYATSSPLGTLFPNRLAR